MVINMVADMEGNSTATVDTPKYCPHCPFTSELSILVWIIQFRPHCPFSYALFLCCPNCLISVNWQGCLMLAWPKMLWLRDNNEFKLKSVSRYTKSDIVSKLLQWNGNLSLIREKQWKNQCRFSGEQKIRETFYCTFWAFIKPLYDLDEWNSVDPKLSICPSCYL